MTLPPGSATPKPGDEPEDHVPNLPRASDRRNAGREALLVPGIRIFNEPLTEPPEPQAGPTGPQRPSAGDRSRRSAELVRVLQRASGLASATLVLGGCLVLLGWQLEDRSLQAIGPVDVVMNPLAALLFVLFGCVLLLNRLTADSRPARLILTACAATVALCGALVLSRSLAGWDVRVDEWLFRTQVRSVNPPDWMAANTALHFLLLGLALLFRRTKVGRGWRPAHGLVLPAALMSLLVVIGYLYNAVGFITFQLHLPMALNTALFFVVACFAFVAAHPNAGTTALLVSDSAGGTIIRRLLPALLLIPLVLGVLVTAGVRADWYDPMLGIALLTLATIVLSVVLTTTTAGALHRSDLALRASEAHFRTIIENASDFASILGVGGVSTYQSPAIEHILGYKPEDIVGTSSFERIHPEDWAVCREVLGWVGAHPGETRSVEFRYRHKNGSWRVIEARARTLLPDSAAGGVVVNSRDVTERTKYEDDLRQAVEAAELANRAKSEFLSRMSHELRTPMNSILGFGQLLARKDLPPDQRKGVLHILKAGEHLLKLINDVLEISSIEAGRETLSLEPVHVATVLQETWSLVQPLAAQRGITLHDCDPDSSFYLYADRQRLVQVLLNLLANAIKYNRPHGSVSIVCEERVQPDGTLMGMIGVRDTGPGIRPEEVTRLFVPFERLSAAQSEVEGTGLGLALSRRLVEAMGGKLTLETHVGEGTTFWVELASSGSPIAIAALQGDEHLSAPAPNPEATPATILYIEDNLPNLELVKAILSERPNITLLSSVQGQMGLDLAVEHSPELILLDMHLPDIRGDEVFRRLQQDSRTAQIPVVILSADATDGSIARLIEAGAEAYLTKPLDVAEFFVTIDRLLPPHSGI